MTPKDNNAEILERVKGPFRQDIIETKVFRGELTLLITKGSLRAMCNFLKTDPELRMNYLSDISGVDYPDSVPRFEVVYHLYSIPKKHRIRLKVKVAIDEGVPSVADIWVGAGWPEREAYDMFGIRFEGHPNLKRIYMPEDWDGYPLRKDYPLRGFKDKYNPYGEDREED